ncbi:MAG TPA: hypothetical protein VF209_05070 [Patescibacteria group bacterium]
MSAHLHTALLAVTVAFVYWWLHTPWLVPYSLQAFAVAVLLYFIVKRLRHAKLWHLAPTALSAEMMIATFAFLILIGHSGNTTSIFFPLTFVHLFFLVLSAEVSTTIIMSILIVLFHYGMSPTHLPSEWPSLLTIPLITLFFLFTKNQYDEVQKEKKIIAQEERALESAESQITELKNFVSNFLRPKVQQLQQLSAYAQANQEAIKGQLSMIESEVERVLRKIR